jgi:hypothetical protein
MPRLDYSNGSCPSLLLEPSRTNLIEYSEYITSANNASISHNATESPEGELNAPIFTATTTDPFVRSSNISITTGTSYSISFYIKGFGTAIGKQCTTSVTNTGSETFTLTGSWQRITYTGTATDTRTNAQLRIDAPNVGAVVGEQFSVWGMQAEQDATYPTSYIPTYGVSQTRLDDAISISNLQANNFFGQNEGSVFVDWEGITDISNSSEVTFRTSSNGEQLRIGQNPNGSQYILDRVHGQGGITTSNGVKRRKIAFKYSATEGLSVFEDGEKLPSTFANGDYSIDKFDINLDSNFRKAIIGFINFFPTALSDEACIELTTI